MKLILKLSNGTSKDLQIETLAISVQQLKTLAQGVVDIPADAQRVVYRGKVLKDGDLLQSLGVEDGHALHIVRGQAPKTDGTSRAESHVAQSATPSPALPAAPAAPPTQTSPNPYAALFGQLQQPAVAPSLAAPTNANANPWATSGFGSGWMPSPSEAQAMMQNPMVMQMVEQMMRNPQLMQQMLQSNPMLQSLPPEVVQQSLQMMSNPQLMQQMMTTMNGNQNGTNGLPRPAAPTPGVPLAFGNPRELYATQLEQLRAMGFPNEQANIAALQQSQGNIEFAIERLLGA